MKKFNNKEEILEYIKTECSTYYIEGNQLKTAPAKVISVTYKLYKNNAQFCKRCKLYIICENTLAFTPRKILQTHECEIKIKLNTDKPYWAEFINK